MRILIIADITHSSHRILPWCNFLSTLGHNVFLISPRTTRSQKKAYDYFNNGLWKHFESPRVFSLNNLLLPFGYRFQYLFEFFITKITLLLSFFFLPFFRRFTGTKIPREAFDANYFWIPSALKLVRGLENEFDMVLTSSSPFSTHVVGALIKKDLGKLWVADYRDPYSQNHTLRDLNRRKILEVFEAQVMRQVDHVLSVSVEFARDLQNFLNSPTSVIHNGFKQSSSYNSILPKDDKIHLGYFGTIYIGYQNPFRLIEIMEADIMKSKSFLIHFYGPSTWQMKKEFQRLNMEVPGYVRLAGMISAGESNKEQISMDYLVLFDWEDTDRTGVIPTKFIEYLGAGRPIICFGRTVHSEVAKILNQTGAGVLCNSFEEGNNLFSSIMERKVVLPKRNKFAISKYEMSHLVSSLEAILYKVSTKE